MTKPEICVLVAGVGGGGTGRELMKAFSVAEQKYKIVATDMWENSFGLFETPNRYVIPPANSADYIAFSLISLKSSIIPCEIPDDIMYFFPDLGFTIISLVESPLPRILFIAIEVCNFQLSA